MFSNWVLTSIRHVSGSISKILTGGRDVAINSRGACFSQLHGGAEQFKQRDGKMDSDNEQRASQNWSSVVVLFYILFYIIYYYIVLFYYKDIGPGPQKLKKHGAKEETAQGWGDFWLDAVDSFWEKNTTGLTTKTLTFNVWTYSSFVPYLFFEMDVGLNSDSLHLLISRTPTKHVTPTFLTQGRVKLPLLKFSSLKHEFFNICHFSGQLYWTTGKGP